MLQNLCCYLFTYQKAYEDGFNKIVKMLCSNDIILKRVNCFN